MFETKQFLKIIAVHIVEPYQSSETTANIGDEFDSLITTLGSKIVGRVVQKLDRPHGATYIGRGKIDEVAEQIKQTNADVIIIDAMVKPGQLHTVQPILELTKPGIEVWDRIGLILRIFDKNANTQEAKLQIELARMNYMGPRIYGMGYVLSRQGGGIGTSGIGETNSELMRRHWRQEKKKITDELVKSENNREKQIERRRKAGFKTVSIVGYTNAGKSSLFNVLTKKDNLEKDELFATLDSAVGKIYIPEIRQEILITDTIGFIRNLPPLLISAFKSTLMESANADVILHLIDASDPEMTTKIQVVDQILAEMGITPENVIYVFNKIDTVASLDKEALRTKYYRYSPLFISTRERDGIEELIHVIGQKFSL